MTQIEPVKGTRSLDVLAVVRFILGAVFGWMIWWASPTLSGTIEPWDSYGDYYSFSLFAAGLLSTLFRARGWYWGPTGVYVGQVAYAWAAYQPGDPIILPLPISVAVFGTVQSFFGGLMGAGIAVAVDIVRETRHRDRNA
jgi:hypothetical protein